MKQETRVSLKCKNPKHSVSHIHFFRTENGPSKILTAQHELYNVVKGKVGEKAGQNMKHEFNWTTLEKYKAKIGSHTNDADGNTLGL